MILTLIFIAILVISFVFIILTHVFDWDYESLYLFGSGAVLGLFGTLICGIWAIVVNTPTYAMTEEYELRETVKLYQNEKEILESFHLISDGNNKTEFTSDITLEVISTSQYYERVSNYNTKIFKFKTDTMGHKYRRKNPWLNWFESSAWDFVTEEYLENLTYTIGK